MSTDNYHYYAIGWQRKPENELDYDPIELCAALELLGFECALNKEAQFKRETVYFRSENKIYVEKVQQFIRDFLGEDKCGRITITVGADNPSLAKHFKGKKD